LLRGEPLPGEEHVHGARAAGPLLGGGPRARTKLLLGRRGRAGTRNQGTESSTESSLLRHGRCPSENVVIAWSTGTVRPLAEVPGGNVRERGGCSARRPRPGRPAHRLSSDHR